MSVGRSVGRSVCRSVCRSVGLSVEKNRKSKKSQNQNSLIIFEYLINFAASLRIGSMEGGWGWGGQEGFWWERRRLTLKGPLQKNWGADIYIDKIEYLRVFFPPTPPPSQGPVSFALTTFTKLSVLSNIHFLQLSPLLQGAIFNFHCIWVFMGKGVFFG